MQKNIYSPQGKIIISTPETMPTSTIISTPTTVPAPITMPIPMHMMKLAQAYVPIQEFNQVYPPIEGLDKGTIFPELYMPYMPHHIHHEHTHMNHAEEGMQ